MFIKATLNNLLTLKLFRINKLKYMSVFSPHISAIF